jgi:lysophospholipid hydrolase
MPKTLFNALAVQHPEILLTISRTIALRSAKSELYPSNNRKADNENLKTVAILPTRSDVPVAEFSEQLQASLLGLQVSVKNILTATVSAHLGRHAFTKLGRLKLMSWLSEQEETHRLVIYVADGGVNSPWTQRCIRQVSISKLRQTAFYSWESGMLIHQ